MRAFLSRLGSVPARRLALASVTAGCLLVPTALAGAAAAASGTASSEPTATASPTSSLGPAPASGASSDPTATTQAKAPQAAAAVPTSTATATTKAVVPLQAASYPPFFRAAVKLGDQDGDVNHIKHIRELQYRLRWAGSYTGGVTGYFGSMTQKAVRAFQAKHKLKATGAVDLATWQALIPATTRNQSAVPKVCKLAGWHSCYDRSTHQLFTYASGKLWNVWLVRGGSSNAQTVVGNWAVFARYPKKTSSIYHTDMYWFMKFHGGEGLHGSITMIDPFVGHSHGCVNMYLQDAKVLWDVTTGKRLAVSVYGRWS